MHPRTPIFSPLDRRGERWLNFLDFDFLNVFVSSFKCVLTMLPKVHWYLRRSQQHHTSTWPLLCCQLHIDPFPHSTLPNPQLHVIKLSTSHCKHYIVNLPNWFHLMGCPHFFHIALYFFIIFCPMPKIHSLVAQTRFLWDLFSTHLPSALSSYPQCYLPNTYHPPTSYVPTYPWVLRPTSTIFMFTSAHCQVGKSTWPSFQVDNFPFPNFQVCKFMYALWSSQIHIVKFPSLQDDRCTLPSLQVYTCTFPRL
jgi:hypothetical protein